MSALDGKQIDLFAPDVPQEASTENISSELTRLAAHLAAYPLYLGTCSWSFPGWDGLVYRGRQNKTMLSREGLKTYSQHPLLRTVSIDRSYYGPLSRDELTRYAKQVPKNFRFSSSKLTGKSPRPWHNCRQPCGAAASTGFWTRTTRCA